MRSPPSGGDTPASTWRWPSGPGRSCMAWSRRSGWNGWSGTRTICGRRSPGRPPKGDRSASRRGSGSATRSGPSGGSAAISARGVAGWRTSCGPPTLASGPSSAPAPLRRRATRHARRRLPRGAGGTGGGSGDRQGAWARAGDRRGAHPTRPRGVAGRGLRRGTRALRGGAGHPPGARRSAGTRYLIHQPGARGARRGRRGDGA
jgi:hypothetical protein